MRITDIREKTVQLASPMRNASIGFAGMTASAVVISTDTTRNGKPLVGVAFDSVGRYGHGGLLRERFIPRLLNADPREYLDPRSEIPDPARVYAVLMKDEKPGGHGERPGAVGLLDAAIWDLVAKLEDKPLWRVLAERFGGPLKPAAIPVYASGGHYRETDDLSRLRDDLRRFQDLGYTRMKIKCGGLPLSDDLRRIESAVKILGSGSALAVDCNGTMTRDRALALLKALEPLKLAWVEEPVDPLDFALLADLAGQTGLPLATGENIFSAMDALNLVRYGGLNPKRDLLQMDISLSYGVIGYLKILDLLEPMGWSRSRFIPHAGHLLAWHVVAGLGLGGHEAAPNADDILGGFPPGTSVAGGTVSLPDAPGVGIEAKANLWAVFADLI